MKISQYEIITIQQSLQISQKHKFTIFNITSSQFTISKVHNITSWSQVHNIISGSHRSQVHNITR
jgi:predicted metal-dependent enzyme (double-stranded beta helix superfamily)